MVKFDIRAVQIDLARQIETMEMVKRAFDEAAKAGMNTIVLYLEDRIKTESYPWSPDEESYFPDQIREMVAYGAVLGLELIPVVSPVGHTERFLRHPQMKKLAELRGKIAGAFNPEGVERYVASCPRLPEAMAFFDAYISEVAQLFPSKYFHIGFDEIWDMGFCKLCKEAKLEELYLESVLHYRDLLWGLGKRVMIWDDMLEEFPWVLDQLPRDIVLCAWFYQYTEQYPVARFSTSRSYDIFDEFERRGFSYLACPWETGSIESLTDYARKRKPLGMLLTNWEMSDHRMLPGIFPVIQYAGLLWKDSDLSAAEAAEQGAAEYVDDPKAVKALAMAIRTITFLNIGLPGEKSYYKLPSEMLHILSAILPVLENLLEDAEGDQDVLDVWRVKVRHMRMRHHLWETGYALHEYRAGDGSWSIERIRRETAKCLKEVESLEFKTMELWRRMRPGLQSGELDAACRSMREAACWLAETAGKATVSDIGRLVVRFDQPEFTAAGKMEIHLHFADGTKYRAACGVFKGDYVRAQKFDCSFEVPCDKVPERVSLTVSGYGGTGCRYVTVTLPGGKELIPAALEMVRGQVEHPEFLLTDDSRAAVFHEQEMLQFFLQKDLHKKKDSVILTLKER